MAGVTQEQLAAILKVPRERISAHEKFRTPLRAGFALAICRALIVSEEWLATGRCDAMWNEYSKRFGDPGERTGELSKSPFFPRQCLDLAAGVDAAPFQRKLFSACYGEDLNALYEIWTHEFFYTPRVVFSDSDSIEMLVELLRVMHHRYLRMIAGQPSRSEGGASPVRFFMRALFELNSDLFSFFLPRPNNPAALQAAVRAARAAIKSVDLSTYWFTTQAVNGQFLMVASLLDRVRAATSARGSKAALARTLGVKPQQLNKWLNPKAPQEPGGDVTLRLLKWVAEVEAQSKKESSRTAETVPEPTTRSEKNHSHGKSKSSRRTK